MSVGFRLGFAAESPPEPVDISVIANNSLGDRNSPATRPVRITCVINTLTIGGAERVFATLANDWAAAGFSVTFITIEQGWDDQFELHPEIARVRLALASESGNWARAAATNLGRVKAVHRALRDTRPDVIVSFMDVANVLCVLSAKRLGVPVIACQRNATIDRSGRPNLPWRILRRLVYPMASVVTVQTEELYERWRHQWPRMHLEVIPNALPAEIPDARVAAPAGDDGRLRLVALARLVHQKGFDFLLEAFAKLAPHFPDWDLWIWGEGEKRPEIEAQIEQLGLGERVILAGETTEPWDELQRASLFVLPSRTEGFPNSMLEAMALGLPTVAFDCQFGPREMSRDGQDAVIVPREDVDALREALATLMADPDKRRALGQKALSIRDRYSTERVGVLWTDLIEKVMAS